MLYHVSSELLHRLRVIKKNVHLGEENLQLLNDLIKKKTIKGEAHDSTFISLAELLSIHEDALKATKTATSSFEYSYSWLIKDLQTADFEALSDEFDHYVMHRRCAH